MNKEEIIKIIKEDKEVSRLVLENNMAHDGSAESVRDRIIEIISNGK